MSLNTILATAPLTATGYHIKATGTTLGQSLIWDNGTNVGIGNTNTSYTLDVSGTGRFTGALTSLQSNISSGSSSYGTWNGTTNGAGFLAMQYNGTTYGWLGQGSALASGGSATDFAISYDNNLVFTKGASSTKMIINSSGNVGIGTSSPGYKLDIYGGASGTRTDIQIANAAGNYNIGVLSDNNGFASSTNSMLFYTAAAERMRITSGGAILINTTTQDSGARLTLNHAGSIGASFISTGTAAQGVIYFKNGNGLVGQIYTDGSSTVYATSSDYRLKQDYKDFNGLDLVSSIKTYDYEWKSNKKRAFGVLAHELQEIIPYAVVGKKDAVNEDGSINPQGVDYSMIVPTLIKAIQELSQQNEELSNRLIKLESK